MNKAHKLFALATAATLAAGTALAQDPTFFRIGTGSAGGTYFPIGGTIANGISAPPGARACDKGGQCGVPGLIAIAQSTTASVFKNSTVNRMRNCGSSRTSTQKISIWCCPKAQAWQACLILKANASESRKPDLALRSQSK